MGRVILARRARGDILELEPSVADAVADALGVLERDPESGHTLRGRLRGLRSLRVGSYRVIYQLDPAEGEVPVLTVRHRAIAYRQDPR